jgi:hypothetical protein
MIRAHHRPQRGSKPSGDIILAVALVDEDQRDVMPSRPHLLRLRAWIGVDDSKRDVRVARGDILNGARDNPHQQRRDRHDANLADDISRIRGDFQKRAAPFRERIAGMAGEEGRRDKRALSRHAAPRRLENGVTLGVFHPDKAAVAGMALHGIANIRRKRIARRDFRSIARDNHGADLPHPVRAPFRREKRCRHFGAGKRGAIRDPFIRHGLFP